MENRRSSDSLSNNLWSDIRVLLKEQNERLRIQNNLLEKLLDGEKGKVRGQRRGESVMVVVAFGVLDC